MIPPSDFPAIDATLNGTSALLLALGYFFIRRKRIQAHEVCMLSAFAASTLFLVCYIWYHVTTVLLSSPDKVRCVTFT
jgi:putative membrane protein